MKNPPCRHQSIDVFQNLGRKEVIEREKKNDIFHFVLFFEIAGHKHEENAASSLLSSLPLYCTIWQYCAQLGARPFFCAALFVFTRRLVFLFICGRDSREECCNKPILPNASCVIEFLAESILKVLSAIYTRQRSRGLQVRSSKSFSFLFAESRAGGLSYGDNGMEQRLLPRVRLMASASVQD